MSHLGQAWGGDTSHQTLNATLNAGLHVNTLAITQKQLAQSMLYKSSAQGQYISYT
jgi:hypothetical protein